MPDHRLIPSIRYRLANFASPEAIEAVVALINEDPLSLDECGFRFGEGHCVRPRGHEEGWADKTHINLWGQTKHEKQPVREALF